MTNHQTTWKSPRLVLLTRFSFSLHDSTLYVLWFLAIPTHDGHLIFCVYQEAPIPAMDSLTAAMKNNIVPNQEYLLQGSVLDSAVEVLLHRLRGLCDNVDSGPETFHDHEMCFSISKRIDHLLNNTFRCTLVRRDTSIVLICILFSCI